MLTLHPRSLIGIGRSLATPLLPHRRTHASPMRRLGGFSDRLISSTRLRNSSGSCLSPRGDSLALLLAFGSPITWHGDSHPARSVPCLAHTYASAVDDARVVVRSSTALVASAICCKQLLCVPRYRIVALSGSALRQRGVSVCNVMAFLIQGCSVVLR